MFNIANLPDGTMLRFLDMPDVQHPPMTDAQRSQCDAIMSRARLLTKDVTVSGFTVVDGKPNERVTLKMRRSTLDKINAIAKGEQ